MGIMSRRENDLLLWGGAGVLGALVLWKGDEIAALGRVAVETTLNIFDRGKRLSHGLANDAGIVPDDPQALADAASDVMGREVSLDAYSLARMGRSEGVDGMEYRMHVACNDLEALQAHFGTGVYSSLTALMLHSKIPVADGHYSSQRWGKRYATTRDPYEGDLLLAEAVLADRAAGIDKAAGATKFVDVTSFGAQEGADSYDAVLAEWSSHGYEPFNLPGASSNFVLFRKA